MHESQSGFRRGRSVHDKLEEGRMTVEEVVRTDAEGWVLLSFFDIEKAYPTERSTRTYGILS